MIVSSFVRDFAKLRKGRRYLFDICLKRTLKMVGNMQRNCYLFSEEFLRNFNKSWRFLLSLNNVQYMKQWHNKA